MLSIGAFSKLSSVTTKTLRYYDEIALLRPAYVNADNGYRFYSSAQLKDIILINKLKEYTFSLDEIGGLLKTDDKYFLLAQMKQKKETLNAQVSELIFLVSRLSNEILKLDKGEHTMVDMNDIAVNLVETDQRILFAKREVIPLKLFGQRLGELLSEAMRNGLTIVGGPLAIYHNEEFDPESMDIEMAVVVQSAVENTKIMESQLCATARLKGPYSELAIIYGRLNNWIKEKGYELCSAPYEIYITDPMRTAAEDYITEVYFPVRKNN